MCNLALEILEKEAENLKRKSQKDKHLEEINIIARILEVSFPVLDHLRRYIIKRITKSFYPSTFCLFLNLLFP